MSEHMRSPPSASRRSAGRGDSLLLPACGSDMVGWQPPRWWLALAGSTQDTLPTWMGNGCMQRSYTPAAEAGPMRTAPGSAVQPSALDVRTSADGRRGSLGPTPFCAKPRSVPAPRPPKKKRSVAGQREGE